jgi:putative phosphoribosyl transferase
MIFRDRVEAGHLLAQRLREYADRLDVIVLGLPRGGVPVAFEVAKYLNAPLDVFVVRKLGTPGREELAMGAVASGGVRVLNQDVVGYFRIPEHVIDAVTRREQQELDRREHLYRADSPFPDLSGKTVILVDDGLATGSTMRAGVAAVRQHHPAKVIVAVPVGAAATCAEFRTIADQVVCLDRPEPFYSVGSWYENFDQTTDEEVRELTQSFHPIT